MMSTQSLYNTLWLGAAPVGQLATPPPTQPNTLKKNAHILQFVHIMLLLKIQCYISRSNFSHISMYKLHVFCMYIESQIYQMLRDIQPCSINPKKQRFFFLNKISSSIIISPKCRAYIFMVFLYTDTLLRDREFSACRVVRYTVKILQFCTVTT